MTKVLGLPKTVYDIVCAVCADYDRRENIASDNTSVAMRCKELNDIVERSLLTVDSGLRTTILSDVIYSNGYRHSKANAVCNFKTYYRQKRRFLICIAQDLNLI